MHFRKNEYTKLLWQATCRKDNTYSITLFCRFQLLWALRLFPYQWETHKIQKRHNASIRYLITKNATGILKYTKKDTPYMIADLNEEIRYSNIYIRDEKYSGQSICQDFFWFFVCNVSFLVKYSKQTKNVNK